ncbi:hypothetical protein FHT91_004466 [Rhizobium sp. BK347]|nr:hypothetical protein [Rhizobium sp. BK252]MBB3404409.1 hypothetical protein [Rhizobium sp. BK289]MBB3416795.1 hypothetical protein [Rhizobium sp. BK284]MBB3484672.1 hypothetical protein [Rhizobium sp. BK347]
MHRHLGDGWRVHFRRKIALGAIDGIPHLVQRFFAVLLELEGDADRYRSVGNRRRDVIEKAEGGELVLDFTRDFSLELGWRSTFKRRRDFDGRQIHVRKILDMELRKGEQAANRQQHEQQYGGHGVAN